MTVVVPPICKECLHLRSMRNSRCDAFPDGIPRDILDSKQDHREPVNGDHGIRFKPRSGNSRLYAEIVFDD